MTKENHKIVKWVFFLGILVRVLYIGQIPAGIHQDEAYSGYEAYSLLKTGMDSHGYVNPVYFISWGHGMNVLYAYLTIPFLAVFGLNTFAIRLPQMLFGCLTMPFFYGFLKRISDEKTAVTGLLLLAVNPWHIMLSRWGLEANLVPFFLLLGMYFLVLAWKENNRYYLPAFVSFGLLLYCYAVMWLFVPVFLCFLLTYAVYYKQLKTDCFFVVGVLLLGAIGLPLFLFFLINNGYFPEIVTRFFSIPKMDSIRESEVSLQNVRENLKYLLQVLVLQKDDMPHNTTPVGIYYYCSIPFLVIGGITSVWRFVRNVYKKSVNLCDVMVIWMLCACLVGCMIQKVNVNRMNCMHLAVIYFCACGLVNFTDWLFDRRWMKDRKWKRSAVLAALIFVYAGSFGVFGFHYYRERPTDFYYGYEDALTFAEGLTDGKIGTVMIRYPLILMHTKMLPDEYLFQMQGEKNFDIIGIFGRYVTEPSWEEMQQDMVYVVPESFLEQYLSEGFEVKFDNGSYVVIAAESER